MQFNVYEITQGRCLQQIEADTILHKWLEDDVHRWVDLTEFQKSDLEALIEPMDLHQEIVDACLVPQTRPRVIALEQILFVSIPVQTDKDNLTYLTLVCGPSTLVTIQHSDIYYMDELALDYVHDRRLIAANTAGLIFELLDGSFKQLVPSLFSLRDEVVAMSQRFEDDASTVDADVIMNLAREAVQMEILFQDQGHCLSALRSGRSQSLALDTIRTALAGLVSDLDRCTSSIARIQDRIRDLHQYHRNHLEEATNRRLSMLTLLSAIYLPPTLIAAIYGMNFENIPIVGMRSGYAIIMTGMITLVVGQLIYFRRRGWFK